MSGGSLEYGSHKLNYVAELIREKSTEPLHLQLAEHIDKLAEVVHDVEWSLSGDTSPESAIESIETFFKSLQGKKEQK